MPYYQRLGDIPRKHHIWFHRNGSTPSYKNEGIAYEHVFTTQGFDEAYSIMYHLRPPTRVRNVELIKHWEPKKVTDSPLRHHHLKTGNIPRRGDLYTGRIPMLFNQDVIAYRARPAKAYDKFQYYKNGGADEIIFVFRGSGVMESVFGKLPYRAEDYIVIPRGITYRLVPDDIEEEDYLILESVGPVRIPQRYLNHEYLTEATIGGDYDERSGTLYDFLEFRKAIQESLEPWRDQHLDLETEDFRNASSTGENIVRALWPKIDNRLSQQLVRLRLRETANNRFTLRRV